jgi:chlorophyllide a reductase subunit Y
VGSAPVGIDGTHDWLGAIGQATGVAQAQIDAARNATLAAIRGVLSQQKINGRITLSGYEGSELLVGRLLVECGADLRYVGSACPATPWNAHDAAWLKSKGVQVQFRASLENDLDAMREYKPQLAIGTTPVVQAAKEASIPSLYYTNLISARPLMGVAGAGSLIQVINAAMGNQHRFDQMKDFFGSVGNGDKAGVWEEVPKDYPDFRKEQRRQLDKQAKKRKAEEMG